MILWRRQWHPTPELLPGKSHGRRSLVGCRPWGREESDTTERLHFHFHLPALTVFPHSLTKTQQLWFLAVPCLPQPYAVCHGLGDRIKGMIKFGKKFRAVEIWVKGRDTAPQEKFLSRSKVMYFLFTGQTPFFSCNPSYLNTTWILGAGLVLGDDHITLPYKDRFIRVNFKKHQLKKIF